MLGSVITARDRWLKHGGLILPSTATVCFLYIVHVILKKKNIVHVISVFAACEFAAQFRFQLCGADNGMNFVLFVSWILCQCIWCCLVIASSSGWKWIQLHNLNLFIHELQLYMAPVTHPDRYSESIDFWRNVYGIDSEYKLIWIWIIILC